MRRTIIDEEVGTVDRVLRFTRESWAELKKVSWPTKKQIWYSTLVVLALTLAMAAVLGFMDFLLTAVFSRIGS